MDTINRAHTLTTFQWQVTPQPVEKSEQLSLFLPASARHAIPAPQKRSRKRKEQTQSTEEEPEPTSSACTVGRSTGPYSTRGKRLTPSFLANATDGEVGNDDDDDEGPIFEDNEGDVEYDEQDDDDEEFELSDEDDEPQPPKKRKIPSGAPRRQGTAKKTSIAKRPMGLRRKYQKQLSRK
jgi:hypothetical protein